MLITQLTGTPLCADPTAYSHIISRQIPYICILQTKAAISCDCGVYPSSEYIIVHVVIGFHHAWLCVSRTIQRDRAPKDRRLHPCSHRTHCPWCSAVGLLWRHKMSHLTILQCCRLPISILEESILIARTAKGHSILESHAISWWMRGVAYVAKCVIVSALWTSCRVSHKALQSIHITWIIQSLWELTY